MKVVAFNGSAQKDGNTAILINMVLDELHKEGIETELVQLAGKEIKGCRACMWCFKSKKGRCVQDDDIVNGCIAKMADADGIILGSPTYFANMSSGMKALIDRAGMVSLANGSQLKRKVGAAVVAVRRGGAVTTFDAINHFFFINQIVVPGSSYWNFGFGLRKGEAKDDDEGILTMKNLGQNMAWLLKRLAE